MSSRGGEIRSCQWYEIGRIEQILKDCGVHYDVCDYEASLRRKLEYDPDSVLVLEHDRRIVGTIFLFYDPYCSFLYHLAVDPAHQRRGFGSRLLTEAENRLRMRGTASIAGYVRPGNERSMAMCRRRGYLVYPERVHCVLKPIEKTDARF